MVMKRGLVFHLDDFVLPVAGKAYKAQKFPNSTIALLSFLFVHIKHCFFFLPLFPKLPNVSLWEANFLVAVR